MQNKAFVLLLVVVLVLGGGLGGAFAAGVALGKSQAEEPGQTNLPAQLPPGSGQQLQSQPGQGQSTTQGQSRQELLQQCRQQFPGGATQEQLQQCFQQLQGQLGQGGLGGFQGVAGRGGLTGTIDKFDGKSMTINTPQGPLQATIATDTTVLKSITGTAGDLKEGLRVTVVGQRGADGTVKARSIVITPEGVEGSLGGGGPGGQ